MPSPITERGRYMASVLRLLDLRASVRTVRVHPSKGATPYFAKVGDSRTAAQIGFGAWAADFPSLSGFLPPLLSCAAFVPNSSQNENQNLAQFCDPAIDAKMKRATALQAQDQPAATLLWQEVERDLLAQAPIVPVVNPRNADFVSKRVGNYQYHPQWGVLLSQLWVK
jgi:peptide/nickel transport system substrate-binding protein